MASARRVPESRDEGGALNQDKAPRRVTIVGGGFTGASTAVQLVRASVVPLAITVVEPRETVGPGLAYSATDPDHRLNGPTWSHSIVPDDAGHFTRWCEANSIFVRDPEAVAADGNAFVRRADYGDYLADTLRAHERWPATRSAIAHLRDRAGAVVASRDAMAIRTADGCTIESDMLVVATGNPLPRLQAPLARSLTDHPSVIEDPLQPGRMAQVDPRARVLVVGSGRCGAGTARADHGHGARFPAARRAPDAARLGARTALAHPRGRGARRELAQGFRRAARRGVACVAVAPGCRTAKVPAPNARLLAVEPVAGSGSLRVRFAGRGGAGERAETFDALVNCTGLDAAAGLRANPFLASLVDDGWLRVDDAGIGFAVDANCCAIGADARAPGAAGDRAVDGRHLRRSARRDVHRRADLADAARRAGLSRAGAAGAFSLSAGLRAGALSPGAGARGGGSSGASRLNSPCSSRP